MNSNLNGARWDGISIAFQVEFEDVHIMNLKYIFLHIVAKQQKYKSEGGNFALWTIEEG